MASVLKLSDGTTTVDFVTDSAYRVLDWSPAVAVRRENLLGGRGPYTDVVEEMRLFIGGASVLSKLATLQKLIDQAERWSRGEPVTVVWLSIQLTASSQELISVVYGPPSPGEAAIELPPNFTNSPAVTAIDPVILRFRRAGLWLAPEDTVSGSTAANPTTLTGLLPSGVSAADSPVELRLTGMPWKEGVFWNSFVLATSADTTANAAKKLVIIEAEDMETGAGGPTATTDTTNKARGDEVLRYDMTAGVPELSLLTDISASVHTGVRRWSVFASVRNNSDTVSFRARARLSDGGVYANSYTPWVAIPADFNSNNPAWIYLGQASIRQPLRKLLLEVVSNGTGTIDFDAIALLASDNPTTSRAVALLDNDPGNDGATFSTSRTLYIDHELAFGTQPLVYVLDGTDQRFQNYAGDPALFAGADEPAVAAVWLACGRYNEAFWRATDASGTVVSNQLLLRRQKGQLTVT
jgi:hypothetical protein